MYVCWCGVVWCGVVWCGVVWCGVVWCGVVWCGVVWCGVVSCGVVWCGVVWYGMVSCVCMIYLNIYIYMYLIVCILICIYDMYISYVCVQALATCPALSVHGGSGLPASRAPRRSSWRQRGQRELSNSQLRKGRSRAWHRSDAKVEGRTLAGSAWHGMNK